MSPYETRPTCADIDRACRLYEIGGPQLVWDVFSEELSVCHATALVAMARAADDAETRVLDMPRPQRRR